MSKIVIDQKDRRLLLALYNNGRMTTTELAKRAGISQEVAVYRLKKLKERGILRNVIPLIDTAKLSYTTYRLQVKLRPAVRGEYERFESYLKTIPQLSWLVKIAGPWDLAVLFTIKENAEFWNIYEAILNKYGRLIDKKLFTIVTNITYLSPNNILRGERIMVRQELTPERRELDENQGRILQQLLDDGRRSLLEIARNLSLSATTVKYHLDKLTKTGTILGFWPVTDISGIGYEHFKVALELDNPEEKRRVRELLLYEPSVIYITESLGHYDIEFECECKSVNEVLQIIKHIKSKIRVREEEILFGNEEVVINKVPVWVPRR